MSSLCRRSLLLLLAAVAAIVALPTGTLVAPAAEARFVRIGTGPIGGTYFPIGGSIANMISEPPGAGPCSRGACGVPGLIAAAVSTSGSLDNVRQLVAGSIELALCQADIARDAFAGEGEFAGHPVRPLRAIANLFPEALHVVVREGAMHTIADLRGKRVSLGETNSGTLTAARMVLRVAGLRLRDITARYERLNRSMDMLVGGEIDAFFIVGGAPVAAVAMASERMPIALLPIPAAEVERLVAAHPQFIATTIPAGTYAGVGATPTIAVRAQLVTLARLPDDLVFAITRALWDPRNRKLLDINPIGPQIRIENAEEHLAVPLHPGARRYYAERATTPPGERSDASLPLPDR
ncbi:MAG: TAXI family TRAP transporter solute-binding subunit [Rhodospirillales bacterium]|nr:TAXI family TRAP transporter solute-binding subunit [Rhodospirillales bacterium]